MKPADLPVLLDTRSSWLIQRLNAPYEDTPEGDFRQKVERIFGEGGGGLGLSDEARQLLRHICAFDYMGSAEFEFGALPRALRLVAEAKKLAAFEFVLEAKNVAHSWWRECIAKDARYEELKAAKAAGKRPPRKKPLKLPAVEDRTFYILCPEDWKEYTKALIVNCAQGKQRLKESTYLQDVLDPDPRRPNPLRVCGWFEITHGLFFFIDKTMHERMCALFGVRL